MDLLSLVLTLRPAAAGTPPPRLGRAAHAILLRQIAAQDPALAESLHSDDGPKPLTCSDLLGARRREQVTPDETYTLRYTALTAPVAAALANAFAVGQTLTFEDVTFEIVALTLPPTAPNPQSPIPNPQSAVPSAPIPNPQSAIPNPQSPIPNPQSPIPNPQSAISNPQSPIRNPQSPISNPQSAIPNPQSPIRNPHPPTPWTGSDNYQDLAARHLLPAGPLPPTSWSILLAAPLAFQSKGKTQPFPLPELFFGSLVQRWNTFAPVALPEEGIRRYAEELVAVSRFELRSAPGWDRGPGLRIGAIGKITYRALNRDRYWLAVLSLLAEYALYSGAGAMTTAGMGQVRLLDVLQK